ncbi:MAG: citrate synthase [Clostridia bacterium]
MYENKFISNLCVNFEKNNKITPESFETYDIKRGLRNRDGTGVVAGISCIGDVHGYTYENHMKTPDKGILTYRGIDVSQIVENISNDDRFGFEEICYLLLVGNLPSSDELHNFTELLGSKRELPKNFTEDMIMRAPSSNVMNKLASSTLSLYAYDKYAEENSTENIMRQAIELIARFPIIISHAYQAKRRYYDNKSMYLHHADKEKSTSENILKLIRRDKKYSDAEAKLLDKCLIVHAEHGGGNNSAFTARVLSSASTDTYSAIAASVGSLKGFRHGGANIKVTHMFDNIKHHVHNWENEDEVMAYLEKILRKKAYDKSGLIYGMGHAIYTLNDPRADIICDNARILAHNSRHAREFALIELVEKLTTEAYYNVHGVRRTMCANVDMYSGFVYKLLGIPEDLFTPIFAASRIVGWMAHRMEEIQYGGKIIRPAYQALYNQSEFVALDERG